MGMRRHQTATKQWLIVCDADDRAGIESAGRLRAGAGVILLGPLAPREVRSLRSRGLALVAEHPRDVARVHCQRELTRALLARTPVILLSPIYPTASHPGWTPLPRMRAAALARLGSRKLFALGGMDARKFARVSRLGFQGWAGISAFKT
jgi:thiamine-phosphate pyrophosphorylase